MRPPKISTNFAPYTDSDFQVKATVILSSMQGNPHFTNPVPPLVTISQLLVEYSDALQNAINKDIVAITIKNNIRSVLEHQLARLALYVMYIADDNEAILLSSGYSLTKTPSPQKIAATGNVMLRNGGNSGQMMAKIKAVKGAKSYLFEITPGRATENSVWEDHNSSRCTFTFNKLTPGQLYSIKVAALGTGLQKTYSGVFSQWAQ
jgi:hypothetical protein